MSLERSSCRDSRYVAPEEASEPLRCLERGTLEWSTARKGLAEGSGMGAAAERVLGDLGLDGRTEEEGRG